MNELDIITRTRGAVNSRNDQPTGENLFLVWGYPTAFFLLVEFAALMLWNENWCSWLWVGIPLVGAPLMFYYLNKDYERTGHKTLDANLTLQMWLFIGFACCAGGFATGFAGVFQQCFLALLGLLCGMGCFLTGVILRFRPKKVCGIIASALSFAAYFFQGELWPWQLVVTAVVVIICLIIPGHLYNKYAKEHGI